MISIEAITASWKNYTISGRVSGSYQAEFRGAKRWFVSVWDEHLQNVLLVLSDSDKQRLQPHILWDISGELVPEGGETFLVVASIRYGFR
jgi:hypothetical protein